MKVKLTLEYEIDGWESEDLNHLPMTPEYWEEYFYQADALTCDMNIVKVEITK